MSDNTIVELPKFCSNCIYGWCQFECRLHGHELDLVEEACGDFTPLEK